jgi:tRNA threonylcarbamoyladenosine biosynthesis protein TsaE
MMVNITSTSPLMTEKIGMIFSKILFPGDTILLDGELGAGKTTFIHGVAKGLGLKEELSSPSFTIINVYNINSRKELVHADFYRLDNIDEILNTGIEEYFNKKNKYIFVEWGSKIKSYLRNDYIEIEFKYVLESNKMYRGAQAEQIRSIIFNSGFDCWVKRSKSFRRLLRKNDVNID